MEYRNIVVVLGLVEIASNWVAQSILFGECTCFGFQSTIAASAMQNNLEKKPSTSKLYDFPFDDAAINGNGMLVKPVRCYRFVDVELLRLLVDKENVTMQAGVLGSTGSDILDDGLAISHSTSRNIDDQPMTHLTECRLLPRWSIRIGHNECV